MKKVISVLLILVILLLPTGCSKNENTVNRILFDTAVTLTAQCSEDILLDAIKLCEYYDNLLSRTKEGSDVWRINNTAGLVQVDPDTVGIILTALKYCEKTQGKYDITVTPISSLWDFNNGVVPDAQRLYAALQKVDYKKIEVVGNTVNAHGTQLDLGSAAKGFIADKLREYFEERGVEEAIINLGGNVYVMGEEYSSIGVRSPFDDGISGVIKMNNTSAVTSGIYQRCFEKQGRLYHHILNPKTGYSLDTDLASVTVVGESSLACDILSTACMVSGSVGAEKLLKGAKLGGVLILRDGSIKSVGNIEFSPNK